MMDDMDPRMRGADAALGKLGEIATGLRKKRFGSKMSPPTTVTISIESEPEGKAEPGDSQEEDDMEKLRQMYGDLG